LPCASAQLAPLGLPSEHPSHKGSRATYTSTVAATYPSGIPDPAPFHKPVLHYPSKRLQNPTSYSSPSRYTEDSYPSSPLWVPTCHRPPRDSHPSNID